MSIRVNVIGTGSKGNSYILEENGKFIILDAGVVLPEIKKRVGFRISDIVLSFISHKHYDHSRSESKLRNMGIKIFAPYHNPDRLMQVLKTGGWYLKSFPLSHGDCPNAGCYIMSPEGHKLVYATDFQRIDYKFTKLRINTFLIECNHDDEIDPEENEGKWEHSLRDHSSISTVCEFLRVNKTNQLKSVVLLHGSDDNLDVKDMVYRIKDVVGENVNVFVAGKGVSFYLDE